MKIMEHDSGLSAGFSLVELSVSMAITLVALAISMAGMKYAMRGSSQNSVQNELDVDVQLAMERVKYDLRMTSLDQVFFYPEGPGPYSAMSFPMASDSDGDGRLDFDGEVLLWNRTVIYHVWQGQPYQLRKTVFSPRVNLTDVQRQAQLNAVFANGSGAGTYNGTNAQSTVVFENLFQWQLRTVGSTYDCYAPSVRREMVSFGSAVLDSGTHSFRFEVVSKNSASSGRNIGLDLIFASPSYSPREGEAQLPASVQVGVAAAREYRPGGSWSGNHHLLFPATANGHYFDLSMENDRWEETNFDSRGDEFKNARVVFDDTLTPKDFVVRLDGPGTNWTSAAQTGTTNTAEVLVSDIQNKVIRVPIRGGMMIGGGWLGFSGRRCRMAFKAGSASFTIDSAFISESASSETNTMNTIATSTRRITFGGANGIGIAAGQTAWSDLIDFPLDKDKSYHVTYSVRNGAGHGYTVGWPQSVPSSLPGCYVVNAPVGGGEAVALQADWRARGDVFHTNMVLGLRTIYSTCPEKGRYVSPSFDTQQSAPAYSTIAWNADVPSGTALNMYVRTAANSAMSSAAAWTNLSAVSQGAISPGNGRYVQFAADLFSSSTGEQTPLLKDVRIRWIGVKRGVDVAAVVTKGPDYGVVKVTVDGKPLSSGLMIDLEIFKEARGFKGTKLMTSSLRAEVMPRNSGR
ncbi:MAG: hypothetical protein FJ224_00660 [Lentisphaerae bacterium]|nr:hypothetical protein [Lentisphaerota bacterium]